ncbi:MAG: efflux RND transporter periplasmic adaptor subunit [Myxococcota bacterium]
MNSTARYLPLALILTACAVRDEVVSPVRRDIVEAVFATGHLEMSEEYVAATNQEGFVDEVFVKAGDYVDVGEPLVRLASPVKSSELATARAQYQEALRKASPTSPSVVALKSQIAQAEEQLRLDQTNVERYRALLRSRAVSQLDYDNAKARFESAKSNLRVLQQNLEDLQDERALSVRVNENQLRIVESQQDDHLIRAVRAGRVLEVSKERGELARKGESLCRIGGGHFQASLYVAEEDVHLVELGQVAKLGLNTHVGQVFEGEVTAIYPAFDSSAQSFRLGASIAAGDARLFVGTQLQANVIVEVREDGLTIPIDSLDAGHVRLENGRVVAVTTGLRSEEWVEVTGGLSDSDRLAVRTQR